jgi:hypothetical protein
LYLYSRMKYFITFIVFFITLSGYSQVTNDDCSSAQNIGVLPTPSNCPIGVGNSINVNGTSIGGTTPNPYTYLINCQTGGDQPAPAIDVWYSFVASGNILTIDITPGSSPSLSSPSITMWSGVNCNSLSGFGCDNDGTNFGNNTAIFEPLTLGQTYYIQISGDNPTDVGNFNMEISNSNDCSDCLQNSNLTINPPPINGTYTPNTTVTFCYTVTEFTQVSVNWLHGVIPTFGSGWDLSTLTPISSPNQNGNYGWYWINGPLGEGWWVDIDPNGPVGPNGDPTDNFGFSNINGVGNWTWCWEITTSSDCSTSTDLGMNVNTTADGETGSWTSIACQNDSEYPFLSFLNCCTTSISGVNPTCFDGNDGEATTTPNGIPPFDYSWDTTPIQTTSTATNLVAGTYTVTVTDDTGCVSTATVNITNPTQIVLDPINHN